MPNQDDLFAIVDFWGTSYYTSRQPGKQFAVIRYSWITEAANKFVGPPFENGAFDLQALKNDVVPRPGWIEYYCRVLKYDIGTIKAANIERDLCIRNNERQSNKDNLQNTQRNCTNSGMDLDIFYCLERIEEKVKMIQEFIEKSPQMEHKTTQATS